MLHHYVQGFELSQIFTANFWLTFDKYKAQTFYKNEMLFDLFVKMQCVILIHWKHVKSVLPEIWLFNFFSQILYCKSLQM